MEICKQFTVEKWQDHHLEHWLWHVGDIKDLREACLPQPDLASPKVHECEITHNMTEKLAIKIIIIIMANPCIVLTVALHRLAHSILSTCIELSFIVSAL